MEEIAAIPNKDRTILLLDGFDEDPLAVGQQKERLQNFVTATTDFRKIIITSRIQFFRNRKDEPLETELFEGSGDHQEIQFERLYLSLFSNKDVRQYLRRKFPFYRFGKRRRARKIVLTSPSLMARPMLLNYIDDLLEDPNVNYSFGYQIYAKLLDKWAEREKNKAYKGLNRDERKAKQAVFKADSASI